MQRHCWIVHLLLGLEKLKLPEVKLSTNLEIFEHWTAALDDTNMKGVDAIYLDYQKVFDRVPHKRLLKKLAAYGIQGHLLAWISSFLLNRQITVSIRRHSSK